MSKHEAAGLLTASTAVFCFMGSILLGLGMVVHSEVVQEDPPSSIIWIEDGSRIVRIPASYCEMENEKIYCTYEISIGEDWACFGNAPTLHRNASVRMPAETLEFIVDVPAGTSERRTGQ